MVTDINIRFIVKKYTIIYIGNSIQPLLVTRSL